MKIGDPIVVPKGTQVFEFNGPKSHLPTDTKRASKATVESFHTFDWTSFIPYEMKHRWFALGITRQWPMREGASVTHPEALAEKARIDAMLEGEYDFVSWGTRYARRSLIQSGEKKVTKEAPVTKRTLMVKGSRWRVTKDVVMYGWAYRGGGGSDDPRINDPQWETRSEPTGMGGTSIYVNLPMFTIRAGAEFTVRGKLNSAPIYGSGTSIPVEIDEDKFIIHHTERPKATPYEKAAPYGGIATYWHPSMNVLEYNGLHFTYAQIEDYIEALEVPETIVYLLKDTNTGEYFSGFHDDYSTRPSTHTVKMATTFKSAKKFEKVGNAQASIMSWTGYLDGMSVHGNTNTDKKMDLPPSWVLVSMNKITLVEGPAPDIQAWYSELMRLRSLTAKFGSAARQLYKDCEGKDYEAMFVVSSDAGEWDQSDSTVKEIDKAAKEIMENKVRRKGRSSLAFAGSLDDTVLMKLRFAGQANLSVAVFEMSSLNEVVA